MPDVTPAPAPQPSYEYRLKFEPVGEFTEAELFVHGSVKGKAWLSEQSNVIFRSLIGTEVDEINTVVKATPDMTVNHFHTELTYRNLAHSMVEFGGKSFDGSIEEKLKKIRAMAGPILARLSIAYLEFGHHVDELFVGKVGLDTAKKS